MKNSHFSIIVAFVLFLVSCKQKENKEIIPVNMSDTIATEKEINVQTADTIHLSDESKEGVFMAEGQIDSLHSRIYVKFVNDDTGILKATVKPENLGNIRFNQIIFPDKTADGPFGQDLEMQLDQTGEHTLIIGHSLMAENPYIGKFKIELRINPVP